MSSKQAQAAWTRNTKLMSRANASSSRQKRRWRPNAKRWPSCATRLGEVRPALDAEREAAAQLAGNSATHGPPSTAIARRLPTCARELADIRSALEADRVAAVERDRELEQCGRLVGGEEPPPPSDASSTRRKAPSSAIFKRSATAVRRKSSIGAPEERPTRPGSKPPRATARGPEPVSEQMVGASA